MAAKLGGRRSAFFLTAGCFTVVAIIFLWPTLFGGRIFSSGDLLNWWPPFNDPHPAGLVTPSDFTMTDPVAGLIPDTLLTRSDAFAGGALWNPYVGGGHPLLASVVHAPLFPLTWLEFVFPFWHSLAWVALGKLLIAGAGTGLLCRRLGLGRAAALFGATAYTYSVLFYMWMEHPQTFVWGMLPWMLACTHAVMASRSRVWIAALALSTGLCWLGGHPETAFMSTAAASAFALFLLCTKASTPRGWLRFVLGMALGGGIGTLANIPLVEMLGQAGTVERGGWSIPATNLQTFFFPELWGSPSKAYYTGAAGFAERTAYFGVLPLAFAISSLGRRRPRTQWFFLGTAVVCTLASFHLPVITTLISHAPGANVMALRRLMIVAILAATVLAAYGLQRFLDGDRVERRHVLTIMAAVVALPVVGWLIRVQPPLADFGHALGQVLTVSPGEKSATVVELASVVHWTAFGLVGIAALALAMRLRRRNLAIAAVWLITVVDLLAIDHGLHGYEPLANVNPPVPQAVSYLQQHVGHERMAGDESAMPANVPSRYGIRDARIAIEVPSTERYTSLWQALGGTVGDQGVYQVDTAQAHQLADLFSVRYVLLAPGRTKPLPAWLKPELVTPGGTVALNTTALPRAWMAYSWRVAAGSPDALAQVVGSSTRQSQDSPVLEGAPPATTTGHEPATAATVIRDDPETVTMTVDALHDGYLVLNDTVYPGWAVTVDGHRGSILPANENVRAVAVSAGHHVVTFSYAPPIVKVSAAVSVLALMLTLALAGSGIRRARKTPGAADRG